MLQSREDFSVFPVFTAPDGDVTRGISLLLAEASWRDLAIILFREPISRFFANMVS